MDVGSGQRQHGAERLGRKEDAVAFIPPEGLPCDAQAAQPKAGERDEQDRGAEG
jgi:hypothetical protein